MPLGIRPTIDFAFKLIFGTPENRLALISLLNSILKLASPIVDVTLVNPYNLQDFRDDKLSIIDVKAVDRSGAIYSIEMQLTIFEGLIRRFVFYGCELYVDQLRKGDSYTKAHPVYSICLVDGILWKDASKVHHAFRFTDAESGRVLPETIEIHTLELGRYNLTEADLKTATMLECWLFWLLHAHEYDADELRRLFPQPAIRQATETIVRISQVTEDKAMYDAREWAIRDYRAAMDDAERKGEIKGKIEGEIKLIRTLQSILSVPISDATELRAFDLPQLEAITSELQDKLRNRTSS